MRIRKENPIFSPINSSIIDLFSPASISYFWNFGSLLGFMLSNPNSYWYFLSNALLCRCNTRLLFYSPNHKRRQLWICIDTSPCKWCFSLFFCAFTFILQGACAMEVITFDLRHHFWFSGITIFLIMMLTAFIGYIFPWGQMSFWGPTVITNFLSAIPYIGTGIVQWVWWGFSVNNATLNRFFSLHNLFPFILAGLILIHLVLLQVSRSNIPIRLKSNADKVPFHIYFITKDFDGFVVLGMLLSVLLYLISYNPNLLGDPENFINANPLVNPVHVMPEWYFSFAYAILRTIPNKLGNCYCFSLKYSDFNFSSFFHTSELKNLTFRPLGKFFYLLFMINFLLLTWIGSKPVDEPFILLGHFLSIFYFSYFLLFIPRLGILKNSLFLKLI